MHHSRRVLAATSLRRGATVSAPACFLYASLPATSRRFRPVTVALTHSRAGPSAALTMPTRHQHATPSAAPTEAAQAAQQTATSTTPSPPAADEKAGALHIDPRRLPSTIPGITQEELAARISAYHTKKAQEAHAQSNQALAQEVELMRRSLSPNDFAEFMAKLEKDLAAAAKEQAKLAAMSPVELHHYQMKKKRQAVRYEWYKTFVMLFALVGSTALLFSLFIFFE